VTTPHRRPLLIICVACFVLGSAVMVVFDQPLARIVGVALLFAFIVSGVFLVADPDWLARDEDA
jgi:energy-converting hydrogenase Eha subunit C